MRKALEEGVDPHTESVSWNKTCFALSVLKDQEEVANLILSWPGIEVNAKDHTNSTALHYVCGSSNVAILRKLLAVPGLLLNERSNSGLVPIAWAIRFGNVEGVRMMAAVAEVDLEVCKRGKEKEVIGIFSPSWVNIYILLRLVREQQHKVSKVCDRENHLPC